MSYLSPIVPFEKLKNTYCNRRLHGAKDIYARKLERDDPGAIEYLFKLSQKSKQWRKDELEAIAEERAELIKQLEENG